MLKEFPQSPLDPGLKTGLILCGMGGPDSIDSVEPFLRNLFRDPAILPVPRFLAQPLGWFIARSRSADATSRYLQISPDCVSPQIETTGRQANLLAERLSDAGMPTMGTIAMRYWRPWPETAIRQLLDQGAQQFIVVPTYPQYAGATTGSTIDFVMDKLAEIAEGKPVHVMPHWHLLEGYVQAMAEQTIGMLEALVRSGVSPEETALLYVAHSLPESHIRKGDPYLAQTQASVEAIHKIVVAAINQLATDSFFLRMLTGSSPSLAFQSKVGPVRWLGPNIISEVKNLGHRGCRHLVVQPVSFTCEHVETIIELDDELKALATGSGITDFHRGQALNTNSGWLDSMATELSNRAYGNTKRGTA